MGTRSRKPDEERIAALRGLVEQDPKDEIALYMLGSELLRAGRAGEAAGLFRRALTLHPGYFAAWRELARACLEAGRPGEAAEALRQGIPLARSSGDAQAVKEMEGWLGRARDSSSGKGGG